MCSPHNYHSEYAPHRLQKLKNGGDIPQDMDRNGQASRDAETRKGEEAEGQKVAVYKRTRTRREDDEQDVRMRVSRRT